MPETLDPTTGAPVWDGAAVPLFQQKSIRQTLVELEVIVESLEASVDTPDLGTIVRTFAELQAAVLLAPEQIALGDDIRITASITLPTGTIINYLGHKIIQDAAWVLTHNSALHEGRKQLFSGFTYGKVLGTFGGVSLYPEWWGLTAGNHDIAINCAIQAGNSKIISLGAKTYDTARPIDLRGSCCMLQGAGALRTTIQGTALWASDTFISSALWNAGVLTANTHTALIWIGGSAPAVQTMFSGIRGVTLSGYHVVRAYTTKRISLIATNTYIEECSIIEDVAGSSFTGFCFGATPSALGYNCTINGLSIKNFTFGTPIKRDSYPLFFGAGTNVCTVECGTLDMRVGKAQSASYGVTDSNGAGGSAPDLVQDFPTFGIWAQGNHLSLKNIHVEGVTVAVGIIESDGINHVDVEAVDLNWGMGRGAVYYNDPSRVAGPPPPPDDLNDIIQDSCVVLIAKQPGTSVCSRNYKDSATVRGICNSGPCNYLLRDGTYDILVPVFGNGGQFPAEEAAGLAFYARTNGFLAPFGDKATAYSWWNGGHFTVNSGTDEVTTSATHNLSVNQLWIPTTSGALPGGLVSGQSYWVRSVVSSTKITLSASYLGGLLDISAVAGSGTHSWAGRYYVNNGYDPNSPPSPLDKNYYSIVL